MYDSLIYLLISSLPLLDPFHSAHKVNNKPSVLPSLPPSLPPSLSPTYSKAEDEGSSVGISSSSAYDAGATSILAVVSACVCGVCERENDECT